MLPMKRTKLRYKLYIFQIVLSLILFLFLGFTYYSYQNQYKKDIQTSIQNEVNFHKIEILSSLQTATEKLKKQKDYFMSIHKDSLEILKKNPSYDLKKLKNEIKSKYLPSYIDVELFLIDKTYTIYKTTYPKDLGFNLSIVTEAKAYLDKTTKNGKIYISDFVSTDALDMKYKLYSYSKLKDNIYFEVGFIDNSLTDTMESLLKNTSNASSIKIKLYNVSKDDKQYYYYQMKTRSSTKSKEKQYKEFKRFNLDEKTDNKIINALKSDSQIELINNGIDTIYTKVFNGNMFPILGFENIIMKVDIDISEKLKFLENLRNIFLASLVIILIFLIGLFVFIKNEFTKPIENIVDALTSHTKVKDKTILSSNNELSEISNNYNKLFDKLTEEINLNKQLLLIDPLTKSYNRKAFDNTMTEVLSLFNRYNTPFSVILLDIDNFKQINDNYGHIVGDHVLIEMVNLITKTIRETDSLYRVGGEEFFVICQNTVQPDAITVAEKIRKEIEQSLNVIENKTVTVSIGVTEVTENDTKDSIYKRVDNNLYVSKNNGKNRVTSD